MIKMLYEVLVHVPEAYADTHEFKSGAKIFVENTTNEVINTVRHGEVKELPMVFDSILQKGDEIYFHHNIIRSTIDWHGKEKTGMYEFDKKKGLYRCPLDQIFAIERDGGFIAVAPYCFIKPIIQKELEEKDGFIIKHVNTELEQYGIVRYSNRQLRDKGINDGDTVIFSKDSEYQYNVYGEKLYRMKTGDILGKIEEKAWTGEKNLLNKPS